MKVVKHFTDLVDLDIETAVGGDEKENAEPQIIHQATENYFLPLMVQSEHL
ncbi:hypothetical protein P4V54_08755 [Brevibacillus nitrificans]|uniref:hypothetical protein n=1 Tax=Brevibacillus nitrificans TaxID=651560 RepID=UPI002E1A6AC4|nr:hypothetical protein [Brevibacillus nitrificans]